MKEKTMECQGKREREMYIYTGHKKKQQNRRKHYKK